MGYVVDIDIMLQERGIIGWRIRGYVAWNVLVRTIRN